MRKLIFTIILVIFAHFYGLSLADQGQSRGGPDFFLMGDSQLVWGNHHGYVDFFENLHSKCNKAPEFQYISEKKYTHAGYGVSGSGFGDWVRTSDGRIVSGPNSGAAHGQMCNSDEDARMYGTLAPGEPLGRDGFWSKSCQPSQSTLDAIIKLNPKILVASFLGAHQSDDELLIKLEVRTFLSKIPKGMPCIVFTSPPALDWASLPEEKQLEIGSTFPKIDNYRVAARNIPLRNAARAKASEIIRLEIESQGHRCEFVNGMDMERLSEFMKTPENYNKSGVDPYHVSPKGSKELFRLMQDPLCSAFGKAIGSLKNTVPESDGSTATGTE